MFQNDFDSVHLKANLMDCLQYVGMCLRYNKCVVLLQGSGLS